MPCNEITTIADVLSSTIIPESVQSMCSTSLKLIENASSNQLSAAVEYNQNKINLLLIQLLAINFISQNQKQISNEMNSNNINHNDNIDIAESSPTQLNPLTSQSSHVGTNLEEYCERKLLCLSPILGFSRKNYFFEYNLSNDIRMEIVSYLKPIEIFKNIAIINQQFNKNVQIMHQSYKYANIFCNKHYVFGSFAKLKKYCDGSANDFTNVDWQLTDGRWVSGRVEGIDHKEMCVRVSATIGDETLRVTAECENVAPAETMSCRPGNGHRFVNVLRHGYCGETCDVNLKNFNVWTQDGRLVNVINGYNDHDVNDVNGEEEKYDIWRCGWIDFDWTWYEALERNEDMFGVTYDECVQTEEAEKEQIQREISRKSKEKQTNEIDNNHNNNNRNDQREETETKRTDNIFDHKNKNKELAIFQVMVNVDVTQEYNKHDDLIQREINKLYSLRNTESNRWIMSFLFHIDDIDNFTYFGSKTTLKQQLKIKKYLFSSIFASYNDGCMTPSKQKLLRAVNYANYCLVTPCGVFYAASNNLEERKQFNKWHGVTKAAIREAECTNIPISSDAVNKVYYDKQKDELCIKVLPWFRLIFIDSNAPMPLEKRYIIPHGNKYRLINAKIVDPALIDTVEMENIKDADRREERYFELLREWKGFIMACIDITDEFNQFQERIRNEAHHYYQQMKKSTNFSDDVKLNENGNNREELTDQIEWNNRKYFLSNDEMPYLKYNKKQDRITYDVYVLLESKRVYNFDAKFNFFYILKPRDKKRVLENILEFLRLYDSSDDLFALVCKDWHRIAQDLPQSHRDG